MDVAALEMQLALEYVKMFEGQMAELHSLRSNLNEQQEVISKLEEQLTYSKEIQMITQELLSRMVKQVQEQYEKVNRLRDRMYSKHAEDNSTALSDFGRSGPVRTIKNEQHENEQEDNEAGIALVAVDIDPEQEHQLDVDVDIEQKFQLEELQIEDEHENMVEYNEAGITLVAVDTDPEQEHQLDIDVDIEQKFQLEELQIENEHENMVEYNEAGITLVAVDSEQDQLGIDVDIEQKFKLEQLSMENEQFKSEQEYNEARLTLVAVDTEYQLGELPMGSMPTEPLESMQEHTQECCETGSTKFIIDSEQQHQLDILSNLSREPNSKQSRGSLRMKQVRLNKKRTSVNQRMVKRNARNVKTVSIKTTHAWRKSRKLKWKLKYIGETYDCNECDASFRYISALSIHSRIHTGDKPFMCEVCDRSFSQKNNLKTHSRIHTGDKPFMCEVCSKWFHQKNNLKIHSLRYHTDENPFVCHLCQKSFRGRLSLSLHMRIHSGEIHERPQRSTVSRKTYR